jgi:hypothetical protein
LDLEEGAVVGRVVGGKRGGGGPRRRTPHVVGSTALGLPPLVRAPLSLSRNGRDFAQSTFFVVDSPPTASRSSNFAPA